MCNHQQAKPDPGCTPGVTLPLHEAPPDEHGDEHLGGIAMKVDQAGFVRFRLGRSDYRGSVVWNRIKSQQISPLLIVTTGMGQISNVSLSRVSSAWANC